jgi:hypothetical protein
VVVGRTVRLFLVEGTATGILVAEIMNWTGHVLVAPRSKLPEALKRPEASRTGVYLLIGDDPEHPSKQRVYVGEADSVVDRIKMHSKDLAKDFWTHAYLVTSKDANLTKAHARYLEGRLVELAKAAGRASVANGNEPALKQLPESDVADMEYFLTQLQLILPALGVSVLRPKASPVPITNEASNVGSAIPLVLDSKKHGVKAEAIDQDGEIIVLAGATATTKTFEWNQYAGLREQLVADGSLQATEDGLLKLTQAVTFKSPSAAAAVLLNRNANGRLEWKVKQTGQTLKDWQDQKLGVAEEAP